MENKEIRKEILAKIIAYDKIIICRHVRPDGDCLGSTIGLREILRESFPRKKIYSIGDQKADYLSFLPSEDDKLAAEEYKDALVIVVDTANRDRIDNPYYNLGKEIIKIDHHIRVDDFGTINYVDEEIPATACIITEFYEENKDILKMNKQAALALYVGIITDTGRFRYRGANGKVLRLAALLLDYDLDLEKLYANLYLKEVSSLKLQGEIYNKFKTTASGVLHMRISRRMQKKHGLLPEEAAGLVNSLDSIKGSLIWIFFVDQQDGSIRVRIRSRFVAIDKIGKKFSGGGHANAAGATVHSKKEIKQLVELADEVLREFKRNEEGWL
ncbi:MAG TPA: bifunctional oligoribonuclease/PAP phosphatase NrnA [Bacilli bacterium]|nr:bifunctional oligoribonuclease/PAP phosphatase NrnA [Bacilli bacterium]